MIRDKLYQSLVAKMEEVSLVPPQEVGPLTPLYKLLTPYLKFSPWVVTSVISFLATLSLYLFLGATLVKLASLLQSGF